ncbi:MAG: hypothetical protein KDD11_15370, partial [Acidobacteria bacterium]|nr:hypothetical protein [Acidobacteriota bacterium]
FAAADLHLAGVARADGGWKAYVYAVGRRLRPLETGQTFFDGWVVAVDESGIEIETEAGGAMSIPLAP